MSDARLLPEHLRPERLTRLLDGAVGTELARRGFVLHPPAFSAAAIEHAPELLGAIHRDYVDAGAELVTTGTTCVHRSWVGERCETLARKAVAIAREAVGNRPVRIAGAVAMLPPRIDASERAACYRETAHALADAGVDVLLFETFVTPHELALAARACEGIAGERWAAIVPRDDGTPLHGGELGEVLALGFDLIAVHCCSVAAAAAALTRLRADAPSCPLAAYPSPGSLPADTFASTLHAHAARFSLAWIGACCGSTPDTIAALRRALDA